MAITKKQFLALVAGDKLIDTNGQTWLIIDAIKKEYYYDLICQVDQKIRIICMPRRSRSRDYPGKFTSPITETNNCLYPIKELCRERAGVEKHRSGEPLPETLSYQQVLELVEKFMRASGIRDFCADICGGRCCLSCHHHQNACHKNEGRRLPCSLFICSEIAKAIPKSMLMMYSDFHYFVNGEVEKCLGAGYHSPYFTVNKPKSMAKFKIAKAYVLYSLPDQSTTVLIHQQMEILSHRRLEERRKLRLQLATI